MSRRRTEKDKKDVTHFEKFGTDGNEKADELAKARAMMDEGLMAQTRAKTVQQEREEVYAALQYAASFHCLVEEWKDCKAAYGGFPLWWTEEGRYRNGTSRSCRRCCLVTVEEGCQEGEKEERLRRRRGRRGRRRKKDQVSHHPRSGCRIYVTCYGTLLAKITT